MGQVTGSGSAGRVPVWTSGSNIGNSVITSSGGLVGIGVASSGAELEVNGNTQIDGSLTLSGSILSGSDALIQYSSSLGYFSAGLQALASDPTGGSGNTAIGYYALNANTSGSENTGTGYQALGGNTTGSGNTVLGWDAMVASTTGGANTAVGAAALESNTTGSNNTAIGNDSLVSVTTASDNTAVGFSAGFQTTGSSNIAIGFYAGYNITTTTGNVDVANEGIAGDSGVTRIGTAGAQTTAFIAGIRGVTTGNNNAVEVMVDSDGQLGTVSSSRRYKEDIQEMGDASSGLMRLRPVTFRYKKPFNDGSKPIQYGLIAEEVAEVYPDLVTRSADGQVETVKYQVLDSMLLSELQKQHATITAQQEQIRSLEERLARVEATFNRASLTVSSH